MVHLPNNRLSADTLDKRETKYLNYTVPMLVDALDVLAEVVVLATVVMVVADTKTGLTVMMMPVDIRVDQIEVAADIRAVQIEALADTAVDIRAGQIEKDADTAVDIRVDRIEGAADIRAVRTADTVVETVDRADKSDIRPNYRILPFVDCMQEHKL